MRGIAIRSLFMILATIIGMGMLFYEAVFMIKNVQIKISSVDQDSYFLTNLYNILNNPDCLNYVTLTTLESNNSISFTFSRKPFTIDAYKLSTLSDIKKCLLSPKITLQESTSTQTFYFTENPYSLDKVGVTIVDLTRGKIYYYQHDCLGESYVYISSPVFVEIIYGNSKDIGIAYICYVR